MFGKKKNLKKNKKIEAGQDLSDCSACSGKSCSSKNCSNSKNCK